MIACTSEPCPNIRRKAFTTQRTAKMATTTADNAIDALTQGCTVTSQLSPTAATSSLVLSAMFDTGSGLGLTAARTAVFDPCAASAIPDPTATASNCMGGDRCVVAP